MNQNTHWLDGSMIYGSSDATMNRVRSFAGGQLLVENVNGREMLPTLGGQSSCNFKGCLNTGDLRATEQPQLTTMHTIWVREHNRIANTLSSLNPTWSDETVFQETRRIVVAQLQRITYDEFLPSLLSKHKSPVKTNV